MVDHIMIPEQQHHISNVSPADLLSTSGSLLGTSIPEIPLNLGLTAPLPTPPIQANNFPPPKTDKPRPHVCLTCTRSFARLEHLKRHERSHTKEKPFECPECTRCFARRDLLLRHQQKLHVATTAPARPRANRRESSSSTVAAKVRKNSSSQQGGSGLMRPRANTISHVQIDALNGLAAGHMGNLVSPQRKRPGHSAHPSLNGLPMLSGFEDRGMAAMPRNRPGAGLPRLETQGLPMTLDGNLRTAPPFQRYPSGFGSDQTFLPGNTINPAQLHYSESPMVSTFETPISPFYSSLNHNLTTPGIDDQTFDWVGGFDASMNFNDANEHAIEESSPSAMDAGSPGAIDTLQDVFNTQNNLQSSGIWQPSALSQAPLLADYTMDMSGFLPEQDSSFLKQEPVELAFHPHVGLRSPFLPDPNGALNGTHASFANNADTPTTTASGGSSNRHSSITSVGNDAITDITRAALIASLIQAQNNHSKNHSGSRPRPKDMDVLASSASGVNLPSTDDLRRYINAYVKYFHPHLPFLHIPTLSFAVFGQPGRSLGASHLADINTGAVGSGGCLMLAMAAIGALYEYDTTIAEGLFEQSKKMIQLYLEERRKADISYALNGGNSMNRQNAPTTPLWLVQSMLLNVIYGHNCGDKMSADIASQHVAALVSLARAAGLAEVKEGPSLDEPMEEWSHSDHIESWHKWKTVEQKKRTLFAVYILSSMVTSAYNHSPAFTNSEILLDLPCEEDVWAAESYEAWQQAGGDQDKSGRSVSFATALGWLLEANFRQPLGHHTATRLYQPLESSHSTQVPLISTFGCLILIHSLHNYIWETRQRHHGRPWTDTETAAMHAHIEPALIAWHQIWKIHPRHSLERPNPFGAGPLSADSIPLLDLAYVRLFVNLGSSKEAFWNRDWDLMAFEIAHGADIIQHAESTPTSGATQTSGFGNTQHTQLTAQEAQQEQANKRERQMRKAAYHAAHSLCTSEKLGVTFADFNSRELPIVSALCAFDCAQVLAEWVTTVQERVGKHCGLLGHDRIAFDQVPGIIMLEAEDVRLLEKIEEFLQNMELKKTMMEAGTRRSAPEISRTKPELRAYGSKILWCILEMLEQSAVWPIIVVMAQSLESQAQHMEKRASKSLVHIKPEAAPPMQQ